MEGLYCLWFILDKLYCIKKVGLVNEYFDQWPYTAQKM